MAHYGIRQVMTEPVVTVDEARPFKDVVALLEQKRLVAIPVVDGQRHVVGVISQTDLLYKQQLREKASSGLWNWMRGTPAYKAAATVARDVMSAPPVTIWVDATVAEAARLMYGRGVKRLPVVDDEGRLVGIVAPRDLLKVFLRPDDDIRQEILDEVFRSYLHADLALLAVTVQGGNVTLEGQLLEERQIPVATGMVSAVDGVIAVESHLTAH